MDLAKAIARRRMQLNWSQRELAEQAKVSHSYISHIEKGSKDASMKTFNKIAEALEIPLWKLVREAERL